MKSYVCNRSNKKSMIFYLGGFRGYRGWSPWTSLTKGNLRA